MINLSEQQKGLVRALQVHAPRWYVPVPNGWLPTMTQVAAHWLLRQAGQLGGGGLVVGPAARMNAWWAADWKGLHVSNVKFTKMMLGTVPGDYRHGAAVFDPVDMSKAYRDELDAFFKVDAQYCVFMMPEGAPETEAWLKGLGFLRLDLNA